MSVDQRADAAPGPVRRRGLPQGPILPTALRATGWPLRLGLGGVAVVLLVAAFAPLIAPHDPLALDPAHGLRPPGAGNLFGTDRLGRDVFSRTVVALRIDLLIGAVGVAIPMLIGVLVGLLIGYRGGILDAVVGRVIDVVTAFPFLVLVIAIVAMLGPGLSSFFIAVSLVSWVAYARIVRGQVLSIKQRDYVTAARSLGYSPARVALRHVLPNVLAPAIVFAASDFVLDIIAGASLGFFGLGASADTPEWGVMIAQGQDLILTQPWVVLFPGLAILVVSFVFGVLADALADQVRHVQD
jgi:peptide/nickel transport system permease protein